jgi:hypothetical protein
LTRHFTKNLCKYNILKILVNESIAKGKRFGWYLSFHFHLIGFIDGGYAQCRHCSKNTQDCLACNGFEGRTCREYFKEGGKDDAGNSGSGRIVDVKGARKTIHGTAWYQLNHSTLVHGAKRSCVTTWFGVCSYVQLRLKNKIDFPGTFARFANMN